MDPAIARGSSKLIGSVERGELADLCCRRLFSSASSPSCIVKGGWIVAAPMGSIPTLRFPTPQPVHYSQCLAPSACRCTASSYVFASKAAVEADLAVELRHPRSLVAVEEVPRQDFQEEHDP